MIQRTLHNEVPALGVGLYTTKDAAVLLGIPQRNINRWLGGYPYKSRSGQQKTMAPLWRAQLPAYDNHIELGFRDLIELRFVSAFLAAGLGIFTIRRCLEHAREFVGDERPFSTSRFRTDGRTIFFEFVERASSCPPELMTDIPESERAKLIDLKNQQYVLRDVITQTFKDLDFANDVVARWRPHKGKSSIVIDPTRAFGQPIATQQGVPTSALADAVAAEGSELRVSNLFGVPRSVVRDAVVFERGLRAA